MNALLTVIWFTPPVPQPQTRILSSLRLPLWQNQTEVDPYQLVPLQTCIQMDNRKDVFEKRSPNSNTDQMEH